MPIWDWALDVYARPGVPQAALALQDDHGQNTSFLLWAVWAGGADPDTLALAAHAARRWEAAVLGPLRQVRRTLKPAFPPVPDAAREGLREEVKAAELRAERVLLETLAGLAGQGAGAASPLAALERASAAWGRPAPAEALAALADLL